MKYPLFLSLLLCFAVACGPKPQDNQEPAFSKSEISRKTAFTRLQYKEHHWLKEEICLDIIETLHYAATKSFLDRQKTRFVLLPGMEGNSGSLEFWNRASLGLETTLFYGKKITYKLDNGEIWEPQEYLPFAKKLLSSLKLAKKVDKAAKKQNVLEELLTLRSITIARESKRISQALQQNLLSSDLHLDAAIVVGALCLREAAGNFADTRQLLCRMTMHLALAKALNEEIFSSAKGRIAQILLLTLKGQQKKAVRRLESLQGFSAVENSWKRALLLRNTHNWRLYSAKNASLLEKLEGFRATLYCQGTTRAFEFFEQNSMYEGIDRAHLVLGSQFSVEDGHKIVKTAIQNEVEEMQKLWHFFHNSHLHKWQIQSGFDSKIERFASKDRSIEDSVAILPWRTWAAFYQRHACHIIVESFLFMNNKWGVPEEAKKYFAGMEDIFSYWELFPLVARVCVDNRRDYEKAMKDGVQLAQNRRDLLTYTNWTRLMTTSSLGRVPGDMPGLYQWFSPVLLKEPCFIIGRQQISNSYFSLTKVDEIKSVWEQAPYDYYIGAKYLQYKYGGNYTAPQAREILGKLAEYHLDTMELLANFLQDDPQQFARIYRQLCQTRPNLYVKLGNYLASRNMRRQAAQAYQNAFDLASDRVYISNNCDWLVNYYYDGGREDLAMKVAMVVATIYSYGGLRTMARLQERMGNLPRAKEYYERIRKRYGSNREFVDFYFRNQQLTAGKMLSISQKSVELVDKQLSLVDLLEGTPVSYERLAKTRYIGSRVSEVFKGPAAKAGLQAEDIILAIDGFRIYQQSEYSLAINKYPRRNYVDFVINRQGYIAKMRIDKLKPQKVCGFASVHQHGNLESILRKHKITLRKRYYQPMISLFPAKATAHLHEWLSKNPKNRKRMAWFEEFLALYVAVIDQQYESAKKPEKHIPIPFFRRLADFYTSVAKHNTHPEAILDWQAHGESKNFYVIYYPFPRSILPSLGEFSASDEKFLSLFRKFHSDPHNSYDKRVEAADEYAKNEKVQSTAEQFINQVKASILHDKSHGGWPYRSSLVTNVEQRREIMAYLTQKLKRRDQDRILYAYCLLPIMAIEKNRPKLRELLNEIDTKSPFLAMNAAKMLRETAISWKNHDLGGWIQKRYQYHQISHTRKPTAFYRTLQKNSPTLRHSFQFGANIDSRHSFIGLAELLMYETGAFRECLRD